MGCIKEVTVTITFTGRIETKTKEEADTVIENLDAETVWADRETFFVEKFKTTVTDTTVFDDDDEDEEATQ